MNRNKLYVEMTGRCGNQLFRYAFARYVQLKTNNPTMYLNFQNVYALSNTGNGFVNELKNFKTVDFIEYTKNGRLLLNETNFIQKFACMLNYFYLRISQNKTRTEKIDVYKKMQNILNYLGIYWVREGYVPIKIHLRKKQFISGNYESKEYFNEIRDILLNELEPKFEVLQSNKDIYDSILNTDSVCISIRRGDFFNKENISSFGVCDKNYYLNAKKIMDKKIDNPVYFIFSDDIDWCKKNLFKDDKVFFVNQNMPVYETLRLMYSCKHFIISNSTFSWWGQYLSRNDHKIVISPSKWNNDDFDTPLLEDEWIKL